MAAKVVEVIDIDSIVEEAAKGTLVVRFDLTGVVGNMCEITPPRNIKHLIWNIYGESMFEFFDRFLQSYTLPEVYSFTFFAKAKFSNTSVSLINGCLRCDLPICDSHYKIFYTHLNRLIPITAYTGLYGFYEHIIPTSHHLKSVEFTSPFFSPTCTEHQRFIDNYLSKQHIRSYNYVNSPLDKCYEEILRFIIQDSIDNHATYHHIQEFFPIPYYMLDSINELFPNLTTLRLIATSLLQNKGKYLPPLNVETIIIIMEEESDIIALVDMFSDTDKRKITYLFCCPH